MFINRGGGAFSIRGKGLLRWTVEFGYFDSHPCVEAWWNITMPAKLVTEVWPIIPTAQMFGRPLVPAKSWTMLFRCVLAQCPWAWRILRYFDGKFRLAMDSRRSRKDHGNATQGWLAKPEATMVSSRCHLAVSCCNSDGVSKTWVEKTRWTTATGLVLQWKNKWWVNGQFCSMSPQEYCVLTLFTL